MFAQVTQFPFTVGVKHSKTASNLLKPMEQSNIITQELETTEKSSIFDVEVVTKEHPKTSTKLSKFIKKKQKLLLSNQRKQNFIKSQKPLILRYNYMLLKYIFYLKNVPNVMKLS